MHFKTFIVTLLFTFLFATQVYAEIVPSDEQSPPQPSTSNLQISDPYFVGSTVEYDGMYIGRYIASNYQPTFYGTYLTMRNGDPYIIFSQYWQVGAGGVVTVTDLQFQAFQGSDYRVSNPWSQNLIPWSSVSSQSSSRYQTHNNGLIYYVREDFISVPSSNFTDYVIYNDDVQILDLNWANLTDQEKFNYAVNFSHASLTTYYDSSIPSFTQSTFNVIRTAIEEYSLISYPHVTGTLSTSLSDGSIFDSSIYFIDIIASTKAGYWKTSGTFSAGTIKNTLIDSTSFYYSSYNGSSLDLSLFNSQFLRDYSTLTSPSNTVTIVPDDVVFNVRLRRKSDGCFGNWLVLSLDKTGYGNRDNGYNTSALTGISSGANGTSSIPTTNTDSVLTSNANINVTFGFDDTSLGTSNGMNRLVQNGSFSAVDVGSITSVFGQVPQMFGAVFSFLPPFVLQFIAIAFTTVVAVAIVKAIL